jgi:hypothetical protein
MYSKLQATAAFFLDMSQFFLPLLTLSTFHDIAECASMYRC